MKVARKIAGLGDHELTQEEKKKAGALVHYGFGTAMGAIFGAMLESRPRDIRRHPALSGLGFGSLLFVGADEIAVPALKLSGKPGETPLGDHVYGLASHLVYGAIAGTTAGLARRLL
jgi:putative membrane protein